MRLFLTNELGRLSYLLVLLAMIGFDLAKPHIEGYAARLGDNVSMSAFEDSREAAPQAAAPRKLPSFDKLGSSPSLAPGAVNGDGPILQFSTQMMAAREKARAEGRELTEGATRHLAFNVLKGLPGNERATEKIATVAAGQSIMPFVVLLLTAVTVPVLIWMVTGRVRDIGWSQGVAYAVLGLFFLPKFMGSLLPTGVLHVTTPAFFLLLVVIGLIPSAGSGWFGDRKPVYDLYVPPTRRARRGEFGKRGVE